MNEPGKDSNTQTELGSLLLVDDEENILASLRRLLRRDGYRIHTATGGQAGLEILEREQIDVIVSDQRMPYMTGTEFLSRARVLRPETMRIVLSGYTELESVTSAINEGSVYKFLTKPWDDEQLRNNIAEAVRRKRMDDENRRLHEELASANKQLRDLLNERQRRIAIGEASLQFAHETIASLPLAVVGIDNENLVVLANEAGQRLFDSPLVGLPAEIALPPALQALLSARECREESYEHKGVTMKVVSKYVGNDARPRGRVFAFFERMPWSANE